ncbi:CPBP family intramembrane metalloprotease [Niastella caeni]|uniref:CPBP family intramembrane metalloprotease n=1 Tax=Niastella caeni TaxID=2569763 RepID=A0A4S8HW79_9BACT|nr:type II CAAX endopeptidase family protein [Niastella caeni]THU39890.1 CPBP family intramembrane metalloprotease [Niastella caeni]
MAADTTTPFFKQGWLRAILLMLAFIGCSLLAGIITSLFWVTLNEVKTATVPPELLLRITIISLFLTSIFAIALTVIFRRFIDRRSVKSLGFHWQPFQPDAYTGFCLGVALLGAGTLLLYATRHLEWTDVHFKALDLFIGLALMVLIAFTEEMVFRGYILNNLMESMNKWAALGVSAVLFMIAHSSNPGISSVAVANLLLAGFILGINFIYTRNIWFAICFHFSWNFFQGPVLGFGVSGLPLQSVLQPALQGPWWLTGGSFGLEGSFIVTCLFAGTLLLLYTVYENRYGKTVKVSQ